MNLFEFVKEITVVSDNINIGFAQKDEKSFCYKDPDFRGFKCDDCDCKDFD